jgi:hypothetical protein
MQPSSVQAHNKTMWRRWRERLWQAGARLVVAVAVDGAGRPTIVAAELLPVPVVRRVIRDWLADLEGREDWPPGWR